MSYLTSSVLLPTNMQASFRPKKAYGIGFQMNSQHGNEEDPYAPMLFCAAQVIMEIETFGVVVQ